MQLSGGWQVRMLTAGMLAAQLCWGCHCSSQGAQDAGTTPDLRGDGAQVSADLGRDASPGADLQDSGHPDSGLDATAVDGPTSDGPAVDPSWALGVGSAEGWAWGYDMVVDADRSATYVSGLFGGGRVRFGATSLTNLGKLYVEWGVFVARLDAAGTFTWAVELAQGAEAAYPTGMAVDAAGNVYMVGVLAGSGSFGPTVLTPGGSTGAFVVKLGPTGQVIWATAGCTGPGQVEPQTLAVDASGNVHVTGWFSQTAACGSAQIASAGGDGDMFLAKLDPSGQVLWAVRAGGADGRDIANALAVNPGKGVWVGGSFKGTATFGTHELVAKGSPPADAWPAYVAKVDTTGQFVWARQAGTSAAPATGVPKAFINTCARTVASHLRITGYFHGTQAVFGPFTLSGAPNYCNVFAAELDGSSGAFHWATELGLQGQAHGMAVDASDETFIAGPFSSTGTVGGATVQAQGIRDSFLVRVLPSGQVQGGIVLTGTQDDYAVALGLDHVGNALISGSSNSPSMACAGKTLKLYSPEMNLFVWKLPLSAL